MLINNATLTGSLTINNASFNVVSGVMVGTSSLAITSSYAATASYASAFTVGGTLTAQTLVVQTVSSSVIYSSGSNVFGNNIANTQVMTGSVTITGSLAVVTNGTEFQVTSTGMNLGNALTDSHIISGSTRINPNGLFVSSSGTSIFGGTSTTSANPTVVMQNKAGTVLSVAGFNWAGTTTDNNSVNSLMIIGGYLNSSIQTVATATAASGMQFYNGGFYWYGNSGLTIGSVYTNTQRMFLTVGGNLIIGSGGDGGYKLDVSGTGRFTGDLTATSATFSSTLTMSAYSYADSALQFRRANTNSISPASGNGILVFGGGNAQMRIGTANDVNFDMNNGGAPYTALKLQQNGNTIIINSPDNSLPLGIAFGGTVHGYMGAASSALYAYSTNGGYVLLNASSVWVAASDSKRKRNLENYNLGLDAILGLQPKLYNMDFQEDGDEKQVGLIAQSVKDYIPLAYEENNNFIGLNYNSIIVTMINAIKELKAEIDELKNN
jgi:hypothetical protein